MNRILVFTGLALLGCAETPPAPTPNTLLKQAEAQGCHNVILVGDKIVSGSEPHGEEAFKALAALGVKTIISVDGARPEAETAKQYGIRYVHLPIGYDGVPKERAHEMSRALRDLPGKIYVHCHHGKHRGPAAVAAGLVGGEGWKNEEALHFMKTAGVSPDYAGLYKDVQNMRAATPDELRQASSEFPEAARLPDLPKTMAEIDRRWDNMKFVKDSGWSAPKDHPDIDPPHEAKLTLELFAELNRSDDVKKRPEFMRRLMADSEAACRDLEKAVRGKDHEAADKAFSRVKNLCASCHNEYRNKPKK